MPTVSSGAGPTKLQPGARTDLVAAADFYLVAHALAQERRK